MPDKKRAAKPTETQFYVLMSLCERKWRINRSGCIIALFDEREVLRRYVTARTFDILLSAGWIESDPGGVNLFRISRVGSIAIGAWAPVSTAALAREQKRSSQGKGLPRSGGQRSI